MKKRLMVAGVVALVLASLSGGYLYAAQAGGVSAEDRKQLGLFNGNDEFMGVLLSADSRGWTGNRTSYSIYISAVGGTLNLSKASEEDRPTIYNSNPVLRVLYDSINCSGNAYLDADGSAPTVEPQVIFNNSYNQKLFLVSITTRTIRPIKSYFTDSGSYPGNSNICVNADENLMTMPVTEVTLPFAIISPLHIKAL